MLPIRPDETSMGKSIKIIIPYQWDLRSLSKGSDLLKIAPIIVMNNAHRSHKKITSIRAAPAPAPGVHHEPTARRGLPTGAIDNHIDFRPRNLNPGIGTPIPPCQYSSFGNFFKISVPEKSKHPPGDGTQAQ